MGEWLSHSVFEGLMDIFVSKDRFWDCQVGKMCLELQASLSPCPLLRTTTFGEGLSELELGGVVVS